MSTRSKTIEDSCSYCQGKDAGKRHSHKSSPNAHSHTTTATCIASCLLVAVARISGSAMSRTIPSAFGRTRLCRGGRIRTRRASLFRWNTPLSIIFNGIEVDAVLLCLPCTVGKFDRSLAHKPTHSIGISGISELRW
jgi:hypothetical protein